MHKEMLTLEEITEYRIPYTFFPTSEFFQRAARKEFPAYARSTGKTLWHWREVLAFLYECMQEDGVRAYQRQRNHQERQHA
ncbi:hypothetical protein P3T42_001514 [Paraburkholderia sp. GAS38]|jgi:hypothetical protein|uniref:hypothetical protein n=1 Tax=Paraburkholderia sp. GAS38 TaxID=3035133 RepID=UPI003D23ACAF